MRPKILRLLKAYPKPLLQTSPTASQVYSKSPSFRRLSPGNSAVSRVIFSELAVHSFAISLLSRKLLLAFDQVLRDLYPWNHLCVHNVERFAVGTVFVCPQNTRDLKLRSQHAAVGEFVHIPFLNADPFEVDVCGVDAARVECCRRRICRRALERFGSDGCEQILGRPSVDRLTSRIIVSSPEDLSYD